MKSNTPNYFHFDVATELNPLNFGGVLKTFIALYMDRLE